MKRSAIETDVLVVGGGIAGIAAAERIAREAARRERRIGIILCEADAQLGSGASAGLEGWYHAGSLYTRAPDLRFTQGCMQGLADLLRFYAHDDAFARRSHCNAIPLTPASPTPSFDHSRRGWFARPVDMLLPTHEPAEQLARIRGTIANSYYTRPWIDERGEIAAPTDQPSPVSEHAFNAMLRNAGHAHTLSGLAERVAELRHETAGLIDGLEPLPTLDMSMDTRRILTDLALHATGLGLEIRTRTRLINWDGDTAGFIDEHGRAMTIRPRQCVFATGAAQLGDSTSPDFGPAASLHRWTSVMVTVTPALSQRCFVLLTDDGSAAFNHFSHTGDQGEYSIIADANAVEGNLSAAEVSDVARCIVEKARRWFGDVIDSREIRHHACSKMEVSPSPDVARSYSVACSPLSDRTNDERALWIVPGKFSLFATLGETVHREMEARGLYDALKTGGISKVSFDQRLVALSKSAGLSSQHRQPRPTSSIPQVNTRRALLRPRDSMRGAT